MMTTIYSVELEATGYSDDTFNGTYEECLQYMQDHGYTAEYG